MRYLLDTCVISEFVSRTPSAKVLAYVNALDPSATFLSVITIGEIVKGIEKLPASRRKTRLGRWLRDDLLMRFRQNLLTLDLPVLMRWGALVADLERAGRPLPSIDSFIAAVALSGDLTVVTRNEDDFRACAVRIENPWK